MNTRQMLIHTAMAAVLVCAAPVYSQVLGGHATGTLGGTVGGNAGGLAGSRVKHGAEASADKTRAAARATKDKARDARDSATDTAVDVAHSSAVDLQGDMKSAATVAPSRAVRSEEVSASGNGKAVAELFAASGTSGQASTKRESANNASEAPPKPSHSVGLTGDAQGRANASAERDRSQPAGRGVEASASAEANASVDHH